MNDSREPSAGEALGALWAMLGGEAGALARVRLTGADPVLPSSFRVGTAAQISIAAAGLAAAELHRRRGGPAQRISVDMQQAVLEFMSERWLRIDGGPPPDLWDRTAGAYPCGDGRWVRIHTNFAHHRDGILDLLACAYEREAVAAALRDWSAQDFEDAVAERGLVAAMMRSAHDWDVHPQGAAVAALPVVSVERISDASPRPRPRPVAARPLGGVKVLDLTRIIAGPVAGRTLAAHGADVLLVTGPHLPSIAPLVIDTGRGKLSAHVDLRDGTGRATLRRLLADADVFVQGYRPGAIASRGFAPEDVAAVRPGIVYVSLSAYGAAGPWANRRGFDSIVQTASGINDAEARAAGLAEPKALPCQALDHAAGQLMACGAMVALARRVTEGGSWHVQVSLARTGRWLRDLGRVENGLACAGPGESAVEASLEQAGSGFGRLDAVRHAAILDQTPAHWSRPSVPLGTHGAAWPD